ncbi:cyclin-dependent kinase inhibitor 3 [Hyla sarda]|uniref:cyclin-dependent kinase inhibitor 3 n=1 Tax=Hyla sarda TaxID=327740 RepID=UPI0024C3517E|nr:cyclin-dependent kinase inhibitor 3 [Hyla sarda]XP_056401975.1 cyclin-dependent kinase inhibitor 3 [Hyla sarda]
MMNENEFDSSDEEMVGNEQTPLELFWLSLEPVNYAHILGISALPGCKFKNIRRNLLQNVEEMKRLEVQDVFVFCTLSELSFYRVPTLIQEYHKQEFVVHHYPFPDGDVPELDTCRKILEELRTCMDNSRKTSIHCYGGLGRSCLIAACLLLWLDDKMTPEKAISLVRAARGPGAIQTIKQYNFVNEFRENMSRCPPPPEETRLSLSR